MKQMSKKLILLVITALVIAACETSPTPDPDVDPESLSVSPSTVELEVDAEQQLTAEVSPADAPQTVDWSSDNDAAATVDSDGVVTGVAEGEATITATSTVDSDVSGSASVTVVADDPPTQDEVNEAFNNHFQTTNQVFMSAMTDASVNAMTTMPPFEGIPMPLALMSLAGHTPLDTQALTTLADEELPRGVYEWDENQIEWIEIDTSSNLVLQWTAEVMDEMGNIEEYDAEFTIDWGTTTEVTVDGDTVEAPTDDMSMTLDLEGDTVANFDLAFGWHDPGTGPIDEPDSFSISGEIGQDVTVGIDIGFEVTDETISTTGEISATDGTDEVSFDWDVSMTGEVIRDADGYLDDFELDSGSVSFGTTATSATDSSTFDFTVNFYDLEFEDDELISIGLDGSIDLDGSTAVTFEGTLDDLDEDVPGENVMITFVADNETMTLKEFLERGPNGRAATMLDRLSDLN